MCEMPKKKKALQRPTLTFVPSPDLQPPPVLTPEFAVHNPVTVKPVQVDDESFSLSWVSPQFHLFDGNKKNRVRRLSCSVKNTTTLHKSRSLNETGALGEKKSRYKQLQFINCHENFTHKIPLSIVETNTLNINKYYPIHKSLIQNLENLEPENLAHLDIHFKDCQQNFGNEPKENCVVGALGNCVENNILALLRNGSVLGHLSDISSKNMEDCLVTDCPDLSIHQEHCQISDFSDSNIILTPIKAIAGSIMLAPDTPESDYGLPIRQVQLKYGLRDRM